MFMVTLEKRSVRRVIGLVLCGAVLVGLYVLRQKSQNESAQGEDNIVKITTTQDIQTYFTGYGLTIDAASLSADKVQVPTTWDESFIAFNEVVAQSGYDLSEVKGETVEKWVANLPEQSTGQVMQYAVLLLQESNIVGAYLLEKPSGEVTGVSDAVIAMAELRTNSGADSGSALEGSGGDSAATTDQAAETSADVVEDVPPQAEQKVSLEVVDLIPNEEGFPVE